METVRLLVSDLAVMNGCILANVRVLLVDTHMVSEP